MVLDAALLNTKPYKVRVKWSNPGNGVAPTYTSLLQLLKREPSGHPWLRSLTLFMIYTQMLALVIWFNDITTLHGYLMPNHVYIYDFKVNSLWVTLFWNVLELFSFFLFFFLAHRYLFSSIATYCLCFGFKYCYQTLMVLLQINN